MEENLYLRIKLRNGYYGKFEEKGRWERHGHGALGV